MEAIQQSQAGIMEMFQQRMAQFENDLRSASISSQSSISLSSLSSEFLMFKNFVIQALSSLQQQIEIIAQNVDHIETRSRRKILLVHGVAESKEDPTKIVVKIIREHLKISEISETVIRRCHRMGHHSKESIKPRPILVKFHDISIRNNVWYSKTSLKGTGITISEFLTKRRHDIFIAARQKFGVTKCWTRDGIVHVIGADETHYRINSLNELNTIAKHTETQSKLTEVTAKPTTAKPKRTNSKK